MDDNLTLNTPVGLYFPNEADPAQLGGKGAALYHLAENFLIPDWFAVVAEPGVDAESDIPDLTAALNRLDGGEGLYAVRSSAMDEDGTSHSFAGQLDSYLNVPPHQVADRVRDVWRSMQRHSVDTYRQQTGAMACSRLPTVLVQRMVPAEWAGVAFSADPVTGRRGVRITAAVHGLGESLVSGEQTGDTVKFDRQGQRLAPLPSSEDTDRVPDSIARASAELAVRAERHFGQPQDIEWAWADDRLWLLQSRPITTLTDMPDPDGHPILWDNANIAESYSGVTTPMTFSFARYVYAGVYRQFCRMMRVPEPVIADQATTFEQMLGLVRGRIYYNLLNWYRCLALLPGFQFNRPLMEQMMGVGESLPAEFMPQVAPVSRWGRVRDLARLTGSLGALLYRLKRLPRDIERFNRRLQTALEAPQQDLATMRPDELVAHYRDLESRLLSRWDAPLTNDFFAMIFHGVLGKLCVRYADERGVDLHNSLLVGETGLISVEPARRVAALALQVADVPGLASTMANADGATIRRALADHPSLSGDIERYLSRFGDRCVEELKLESKTLNEDPKPLYRAIGTRALLPPRPETDSAQRLRRQAEADMNAAVAGHPIRRRLYLWVLRQARTRVRERENLRFERTRLFGRVRRIVQELGQRLYAQQILDRPDDAFYLELHELLGFVEGHATTVDLKSLVGLRRTVFEEYEHEPAPANRFVTRGTVNAGQSYQAFERDHGPDESSGTAETLSGTACCSGTVRGRARVVRDPRGVRLEAGDILVAERTDPGWILLLSAASAVVVEHGSLLSHAAIVSRELGLPSVVAVPKVTDTLTDGEWIEVDGAQGLIRRLAGGSE